MLIYKQERDTRLRANRGLARFAESCKGGRGRLDFHARTRPAPPFPRKNNLQSIPSLQPEQTTKIQFSHTALNTLEVPLSQSMEAEAF